MGLQAAAGMVYLANMYYNGWGVEKDLDVAADWCNKALAAAAPDDDYIIRSANKLLDEITNS